MRNLLIFFIKLYQKFLSPDHGFFRALYPSGFCRFYPSCSEYSKQAIEKYGAVKGLYMAVKRILRCNPFSTPRVDKI